MKAVILAAGEGSRFRPLTATRPKHMLPIAGKPALEHLLLALRESGIREVVLVVNYLCETIKDYFKDGGRFGLNLIYVNQEKPLGTANAIGLAKEYVDEDFFLVVYGDLYIHASTIKSLIKKHSETNMTCMAVVPVKNPQQFGLTSLKDGFVTGLVEKPNKGKEYGNIANAGIYIFSRDIFRDIFKAKISSRAEYEVTDTILRLLKKGIPIVSQAIEPDSWLDIGRPWDLLEANERALKNCKLEVKGIIEKEVNIIGNVGVEDGARLRSGSYVEGPVLIGGGSDIGPNCYIRSYTSIGKNVRIGNACEIKASLIFDETNIGHLSYVGDSIIGENCNLGAGTITANLRLDDNMVKVVVNSELVDSGRKKLGTIMGDNVRTGINVSLMPGVKLGPNAWVGPNVTVYKDVDEGTFITQKQDLRSLKLGKT